MGCGCGGRKNSPRTNALTPRPAGRVEGRLAQNQNNQRQAIVQQQLDRIQQGQTSQVRNAMSAKQDIERRKKIQVSLKKRNTKD